MERTKVSKKMPSSMKRSATSCGSGIEGTRSSSVVRTMVSTRSSGAMGFPAPYEMIEVKSKEAKSLAHIERASESRKKRTQGLVFRIAVEHGVVEVDVEVVVHVGLVLCSDEDGVALCDGDPKEVDWVLLSVGAIRLDNSHVVAVEIHVVHGKRSAVDEAKTVRLSSLERERQRRWRAGERKARSEKRTSNGIERFWLKPGRYVPLLWAA